jgi:hypothetical protein
MNFETMKLNSTVTGRAATRAEGKAKIATVGETTLRLKAFRNFRRSFRSALAATFLLGLFGLSGCGVEIRDKNAEAAHASNDLVVDGEYIVPTPKIEAQQMTLHYDRLVLSKGAKFVTNGLNLRLEIGELDSKGGMITTFPDNKVTPVGVNGRSGGNLEIVIGHATGQLQLLMRGEDGGRGIDGAAPTEALRGPKGANGANCSSAGTLVCIGAENGQRGGVGQRGLVGGVGFKGGDSGTAALTVTTSSNFSLSISEVPGGGGRGGQGGTGGPGGFGGDPGGNPASPLLPSYPQTFIGPPGPEGPRGPEGPPGPGGIEQKICVVVPGKDPWCGVSSALGEPDALFELTQRR